MLKKDFFTAKTSQHLLYKNVLLIKLIRMKYFEINYKKVHKTLVLDMFLELIHTLRFLLQTNYNQRYMASVAQVCKNDVYKDVGANFEFQYKFSSFVKTRLNCYIKGRPNLYFDRLVSVTEVMEIETASEGKQSVVFAVMESYRCLLFMITTLKSVK